MANGMWRQRPTVLSAWRSRSSERVIAQQAAESLGVPLDKVETELGDSDLPPGPVAGGSVTTASVCSVVKQACEGINRKLSGGSSTAPQDIAAAFEKLDQAVIEDYAEWSPPSVGAAGPRAMYKGGLRIVGGPMDDKVMFAFGAEFVEVRVHRLTREIRVPRITGAFAGGRLAFRLPPGGGENVDDLHAGRKRHGEIDVAARDVKAETVGDQRNADKK